MASPPYNIILAGRFGVGKSILFRHLCRVVTRSIRGWDKYEHIVRLGTEEVQVVLWDTANMERNNVLSVSKSYFTECVGVMMVYKKGDLQSLMELDAWFLRVREITEFRGSVVFSLWCNSSECFSDEITPEHKQRYMTKWGIPPELYFSMGSGEEEEDEEILMNNYKKLVEAVRDKCNTTRSGSLQQSSRQQENNITLSAATTTATTESTPRKICCK